MLKKFIFATALSVAMSVAVSAPAPASEQAEPVAATPATLSAPDSKQPSSEEDLEKLRKIAQGRLGVNIKYIAPTPIPGLYELAINNEVLYMDKSGDHVLMGELFNTLTRKNLTQEAKEKLLTINFADLPLQDAIKTVHGNGSRQIAVFSDPKCSFCKKLESGLESMKDVTIYTFLYPVITAGSRDASANIWCAKDRAKAWKEQLLDNKAAPKRDEKCDISALDRNVELGAKLGITGTPTIFFPSGKRAPGAVSMDYLEGLLAETEAKK